MAALKEQRNCIKFFLFYIEKRVCETYKMFKKALHEKSVSRTQISE
jgi:hypothetical protein